MDTGAWVVTYDPQTETVKANVWWWVGDTSKLGPVCIVFNGYANVFHRTGGTLVPEEPTASEAEAEKFSVLATAANIYNLGKHLEELGDHHAYLKLQKLNFDTTGEEDSFARPLQRSVERFL